MNDVATCYFIKGEALRNEGKADEAISVLQEVIDRYPYGQAFDPRGWYWSVAEKARSDPSEKSLSVDINSRYVTWDFGYLWDNPPA